MKIFVLGLMLVSTFAFAGSKQKSRKPASQTNACSSLLEAQIGKAAIWDNCKKESLSPERKVEVLQKKFGFSSTQATDPQAGSFKLYGTCFPGAACLALETVGFHGSKSQCTDNSFSYTHSSGKKVQITFARDGALAVNFKDEETLMRISCSQRVPTAQAAGYVDSAESFVVTPALSFQMYQKVTCPNKPERTYGRTAFPWCFEKSDGTRICEPTEEKIKERFKKECAETEI